MEEKQDKETANEKIEKEENPNQEPNAENEEPEVVEKQAKGEMIEVKTKKKKVRRGSYITGAIGALLGAAVAIMPWILRYIFSRQNFAITLATTLCVPLIPVGAFLGYKIFRGRMEKYFPVIISIISLLIVVVTTTVIAPSILVVVWGYPLTFENVKSLYIAEARADVRELIFEDFVGMLAITIIGIIATVIFTKGQIKKSTMSKRKKAILEKIKNILKEQSEVVKKGCIDLNCISKENAINKKEILNQLILVYNIKNRKAKRYLKNCKINKLLKKYKGKYYYDETDEEAKIENAKKVKTGRISLSTIVKIIIIVTIISSVIIYTIKKQTNEYILQGTDIKIKISDTQNFYGTDEEISNEFGESAAQYYDFIIYDKADKYELYGKIVAKYMYEGLEFAEIIQSDRDYYAQYIEEGAMSEVLDKQFGDKSFKSYNYTYTGNSGEQYRAAIYLYEDETGYFWIYVYSDLDVELTQIDTIVDDLIQ